LPVSTTQDGTMKTLRLATLALCLLAAPALAAPEFLRYYGKDALQEGRGGEMKQVEGVDFWENGTPPRHFEIIGFLKDRRHKTGVFGAMRMSGLEKAIAKAAKEAGGDGVILIGSDTEVTGYATTGQAQATGYGNNVQAYGSSMSSPVAKQNSRFAVIRYVPAPSPATAAPPASELAKDAAPESQEASQD
jgi:hypothetical protein